jgi:hypothetical protein
MRFREKPRRGLVEVMMLLVLKPSARALAIVSVAAFVVGVLTWEGSVLGGSAPADLLVEPAVRALGDLPPTTVVPIIFRATNRSYHPIRVVGMNEVCARWACVRAKNLPCVVPARGSADIALSVLTKNGPLEANAVFERTIVLYSDCPGRLVIPLQVSGRLLRANGDR